MSLYRGEWKARRRRYRGGSSSNDGGCKLLYQFGMSREERRSEVAGRGDLNRCRRDAQLRAESYLGSECRLRFGGRPRFGRIGRSATPTGSAAPPASRGALERGRRVSTDVP